jgi:hypothetical protein
MVRGLLTDGQLAARTTRSAPGLTETTPEESRARQSSTTAPRTPSDSTRPAFPESSTVAIRLSVGGRRIRTLGPPIRLETQ